MISNAHEGLKNAIAAVLDGAIWQRCRTHYADLRIMPTWLGKPWLEARNGLARSA